MAQTNVQALSGDVVISSNLEVGTANLFVDTTTSNVGINTNTPGYTLDVAGDINLSGNIYQGGEAFEAGLWVEGASSNISYTGGNVGIGLTNPGATLHIGGPTRLRDGLSNVVDLSIETTPTIGTLTHQAQFLSSPNDDYAMFGSSVAISSDGMYAIVGAPRHTVSNDEDGTCSIFVRSGSGSNPWVLQVYIPNPNSGNGGKFGNSVDISSDGTFAIIGAPVNGASYVTPRIHFYSRNTSNNVWTQNSSLTGGVPNSLGISVSISGDGVYAVAGDVRDRTGTYGGIVHFYQRNTSNNSWAKTGSHRSPFSSPNNSADFGYAVTISDNGLYAIIGATGGNPSAAGSAHVYLRSGSSWAVQHKLLHPSPAANDQFGVAVAISGDGLYAVVGSPRDGSTDFGTVHVYTRTGTSWSSGTELVNPPPYTNYDEYGRSVAISGDGRYVIASVAYDDRPTSSSPHDNAGSVQAFTRDGTTWSYQEEIVHPSRASGDAFGGAHQGIAVSTDAKFVIVGATGDDTGATGAGSAQVFVRADAGFVPKLTVSSSIRADGTLLSFTGQHICFPEGRMSQGLVVSANQNKYMSLNGPVTMGLGAIKSNESLPVVSLSNVANDRSVFGVVDRFEEGGTERTQTIGIGRVSSTKEVGDNRVIVNSIGEGALWVANTNGNLVSGDYLTTSSLPGYAQKQDSDDTKNYTVAKITMACDFSPEDIPVQIIKKKDNGDNDLDPYGRFQWVDTEKTQKAHKVRYLTSDGKGTDQSNAAHIAAYVGCTYHCG